MRSDDGGRHGSGRPCWPQGLEICLRRRRQSTTLSPRILARSRFNRDLLAQVKSELPSTFKAYRFQQHRWSCGPANLFKKMSKEIIANKVRKSTRSAAVDSAGPTDLSRADSVRLDEIVPSLQLLPLGEDRGPRDVVRLLLHRNPSRGLRPRG